MSWFSNNRQVCVCLTCAYLSLRPWKMFFGTRYMWFGHCDFCSGFARIFCLQTVYGIRCRGIVSILKVTKYKRNDRTQNFRPIKTTCINNKASIRCLDWKDDSKNEGMII